MNASPLNIAVVGGGVAGITAAYLLQRRHHVTLYEKNSLIGGHTHTVDAEAGGISYAPMSLAGVPSASPSMGRAVPSRSSITPASAVPASMHCESPSRW